MSNELSSSRNELYGCDKCGNAYVRSLPPDQCDACGNTTFTEYEV